MDVTRIAWGFNLIIKSKQVLGTTKSIRWLQFGGRNMNQELDTKKDLSFYQTPETKEKTPPHLTKCRTWFQDPRCILEELVAICEGIFTAKHLFEEVLAPWAPGQ